MNRASAVALLAVFGWSGCVPDPGRPASTADVYHALLDAEDARPTGGDTLAVLLDGTGTEDPSHRRMAVRALGRLEQPALTNGIVRHLADEDPTVRAAAAEALAQSVHGSDGTAALDALIERVGAESDPAVRAELARSVGRLQLGESDRRRAIDALLELGGEGSDEPEETLLGVALGLESRVRLAGGGLSRPAADLLTELMHRGSEVAGEAEGRTAGHIRALAASALGQTRRLSADLIGTALEDPEPEVRRVVLAYLNAAPPARREGLLRRGLSDPSSRVRIAAIRYLATIARTVPRCDALIAAAAPDSDPAVRIVALETLARACPNFSAQRSALVATASALDEGAWQPAARALLSLAVVDPDGAARLLPRFVEHESPFVRGWAARAAAVIRDVGTVSRLAGDASLNVRSAAMPGLFAVQGHAIDDLLAEQLESDDPQLLMTVAGLLEGAPQRSLVARRLSTALDRISEAERETWRDPRLALLERIEELGDTSLVPRLEPYLRDYDPLVARRVGEIIGAWTGREASVEPERLIRAAVPTSVERRALEGAMLTLQMAAGGALVVELLVDQAPTNVARLVRLAEAGYYDGLTFHRWAANFVIQGGSPGANEYQGDGPYTRDEVGGLPHFRGTVGLSTRGRDTGDAQIFINLVDNPRLDHDYTVMGRLVEGYDLLDGILEGAVIERAVVTRQR